MKTFTLGILFVFFTPLAYGVEIAYPGEPLKGDPVEDGQALYPGSRDAPHAGGNRVLIDYVPGENVPDPDSAYAGFARSGTSEKNTLAFQNGHVAQFVFGGFALRGDVGKNRVVFSGGVAADGAIGKLCGGQTKDGDLEENVVVISGGRVVGDVYGGDADADGSATGNRVEVTGGELLGFVNGGGVSGVGIARNNRVTVSGGKIGMGVAGGFAHFVGGARRETAGKGETNREKKTNSAMENSVRISGDVEIEGHVSGGFVLDSEGSATGNSVEISGGTIRGNVYGGRAFRGDACDNTVVISGGAIKARDDVVYAGYVHEPKSGRATGNTITLSGSPDLATITLHGNNRPTWQTDGNTLNFKGFRGTIRGFSHFQEVNVDKDSVVTVTGDGPHEILIVNNEGQIVFEKPVSNPGAFMRGKR